MPDINVGVTFPGELLMVEALKFAGILIEGQTPDQKRLIWDQWIAFWKPIFPTAKVDPNAKVG